MKSAVLFVLFLAALAVSARPLTATDMATMPKVQTPVPSPIASDHQYVVGVQYWNNATNKKTMNLHLGSYAMADAGSKLTVLAPMENVQDMNPVWTVDGKQVLFLSTRGGDVVSVYGVRMSNTAEAYLVGSLPVDIDTMELSPDGKKLAFSAFVYPGTTLAETKARQEAQKNRRDTAQMWTETFVRRWDQYWDGRFSHVHIVDVSYDASTDQYALVESSVVDVMGPQVGDCPSRPFGGSEEYSWGPKSDLIAYTTQLGKDKGWSTDLNVWEYDIAGKTRTCISCENIATDTTPVYSPDGKKIAYLAMKQPRYESDMKKVILYDRETKEKTPISHSWDRSIDSLLFSADGKSLYASLEDEARVLFYEVSLDGKEPHPLAGNHSSAGLSVIPCAEDQNKRCALYQRSDFRHPAEVFVEEIGGDVVALTDFTKEAMKDIETTEVQEIHYINPRGNRVQAWLHKPYGFEEGKKYPVILYIHGGPESPWVDNFHYRWNPQAIAAQGYVVLAPNFHGSGSFGENYTRSILLDWGGQPFADLLSGLDYVGDTYEWADARNAGAMGASFGGYMVNFLNSQTTRFKCLVTHDGVATTPGNYWETEELYFPDTEFGGTPVEAGKLYRRWSPLSYADKMITPHLIIHGGRDYRIADVAAIAMFNNLQRRHIESKLVRFPDENHWVLNPNNSIRWHKLIIDWLDDHLKN